MIKTTFVLWGLVLNACAQTNYVTQHIKDNGKIVAVKIKVENAKKSTSALENTQKSTQTKQGKQFSDDVMILVEFKSPVDIEAFMQTYHLTLKRKLVTGHYLFHNQSKYKPMVLIQKIIDENPAVLSIFPNWKMNQKIH